MRKKLKVSEKRKDDFRQSMIPLVENNPDMKGCKSCEEGYMILQPSCFVSHNIWMCQNKKCKATELVRK